MLYNFPDYADLNIDDILTPRLDLLGNYIPDFITIDEDLTYMIISPSEDEETNTYTFTYYVTDNGSARRQLGQTSY